MEAKIKISKVALFECEPILNTDKDKEVHSIKLVGDKIFNLEDSAYDTLNNTLEKNIKKKLKSPYSEDYSRVDKKETFTEELFPEVSKQGRKAISLVFNLHSEKNDSVLHNLLHSKQSFRQECGNFSQTYVNYKQKFRGVLGIIKFELIYKKQVINFVSIITADFQNNACLTDPEIAIKQLDKVFDEDFKTIIIYPFLMGKKNNQFIISENQARVHEKKILSDPNILISAELDAPDFPQRILEDLYKNNQYTLEEIFNKMGEDYAKKANIHVNICNKKLKVSLYDFVKYFDIIHEPEGDGIFISGTEVIVTVADHNLLNERRITKLSINDLSQKLNYAKKQK